MIEISKSKNGELRLIIIFSRHAKRRAKLYDIPEATIENILRRHEFSEGEHEIISDVPGFEYPIKIVVRVENGIVIVITNYPLKRGKINESTI